MPEDRIALADEIERYILLCGSIVGNMKDGFEVVYDWNHELYDTRKAAIAAGLIERESDDFNIGVVRGGRLIDLAWMQEGGKATAEELLKIENEIGFAPEDDNA